MSRRARLHEHLPPPASADMLGELARVAAGEPAVTADQRTLRHRLAYRGLLRMDTRARWDGLEIATGWALTLAGQSELSAWEARVRDARGPPPGEVIRRGATDAACGSGHDTQGDSP